MAHPCYIYIYIKRWQPTTLSLSLSLFFSVIVTANQSQSKRHSAGAFGPGGFASRGSEAVAAQSAVRTFAALGNSWLLVPYSLDLLTGKVNWAL